MLQEGERLGLVVADEDLEKAVKAIPSFQVDGRFDIELYKRAVAASYGTAGRFEERLRRDLQAQKVLALLRQTIQVSEPEVRAAFDAEGDRVDLEFARLPLSALQGSVQASAEQVKAFQARSADRIAQAYQDAGDRFDRKKEVRARHILFRADEKGPAEADARARRKAEETLGRLQKGEDFAKLAAQLSEDPGSREKGGDLDWFGTGIMAKPFEDAAFAAAQGALVGPVRSRFGWHLIRVDDVRGPEVIPLEKAAPELARELLEADLARAAAAQRAGELLAQARKAKTLAELFPAEPDPKAAKKGPAPVKLGKTIIRSEETGPFGAGARPNLPRLGPQAELFADALAATGPGLLAKVYDTPAGPVIARVKDRQRPDPARFAAQRAEVEGRLRSRRESQVESAWMKALRDRSQVQVNEAYLRGEVSLPPVQLD